MKIKDFAIPAFIMILVLLLAYLWLAPSGQPPAPEVNFTDIHGNQFTLSDLKGRPVIINFWATECPGCVNEIPLLIESYKKYQSNGLLIIGVAMAYDPESQVKEMVRQKNMRYPIVLDTQEVLGKAFSIKVTPTTLFIDKDGNIHKRKLGEILHTELETTIHDLL